MEVSDTAFAGALVRGVSREQALLLPHPAGIPPTVLFSLQPAASENLTSLILKSQRTASIHSTTKDTALLPSF